ncbi:MAG TPA: hypothetical protein VMB84_01365, partial [Stellaceae bacterium]|nr:hypothetical protein [Stellaceae bacterium]
QLQDQIEAIRREAYAAGYAAAMQAIRDFATRPGAPAAAATPAPVRRRGPARAAAAAKPAPRRRGRAAKPPVARRQRPQRGTNARLIVEVLKAMPSGTARPAEIRKALQSDKGVSMAFTSIRHALGQLATRREVEASADGKTWRYLGTGAAG